VGPTLVRLAIPMVWGLLSLMLFNLVDTFFVGRLGALPLAAMGFTFPVVFVVTGTAMGMGVGMSSVVSRAIGEGNRRHVNELTTHGLLLALALVTLLAGTGLLTMNPVFRALGADESTLPLIRSYMVPWFFGVGFLVIPMTGNSAIRATGDTRTPSLIMITAGTVNALLDPFLIFGIGPFPRLELQGAALATVFSYMITFVAAFCVLAFREKMLLLGRPNLRRVLRSWQEVLHVALPAVGTNLMVPIAGGIITRVMAGYGTAAVAAFGVGSKLESLAMVGCFALSTAMAPFAGQNFGAGRPDRVAGAMRFGRTYCLTLNLVIWIVLAVFARFLARQFSSDPEVVEMVVAFLWIVPASYGTFGIMLLAAAAFNANRMPGRSFVIFTARFFLFLIPLALLGSRLGGVPGVFAGIAIGNFLAGVFGYRLMHHSLSRAHIDRADTRSSS
jgi:putative MATE family efflux protein